MCFLIWHDNETLFATRPLNIKYEISHRDKIRVLQFLEVELRIQMRP